MIILYSILLSIMVHFDKTKYLSCVVKIRVRNRYYRIPWNLFECGKYSLVWNDFSWYTPWQQTKWNKLLYIQSPGLTFQPIRVIFRTGIRRNDWLHCFYFYWNSVYTGWTLHKQWWNKFLKYPFLFR